MDRPNLRFHAPHPETGEPLRVEAVYHPARRGLRDRYGAPLEPDDAAEIILCDVWNRAGEPVAFAAFEEELLDRALRLAPKLPLF